MYFANPIMSWVEDYQAPSLSNQPLLKTFDLICSNKLLQMSSTKQSNSKISEDDSEQDKIDTSADIGPCEREPTKQTNVHRVCL